MIANDRRQLRTLPMRLSEQRVRSGQRLQPSPKARCELAGTLRPVNSLVGDRLDGRERVLYAMIELANEKLLKPFELLALGNIPADLRGADDFAGLIANW